MELRVKNNFKQYFKSSNRGQKAVLHAMAAGSMAFFIITLVALYNLPITPKLGSTADSLSEEWL